jgi:hypothetical protein
MRKFAILAVLLLSCTAFTFASTVTINDGLGALSGTGVVGGAADFSAVSFSSSLHTDALPLVNYRAGYNGQYYFKSAVVAPCPIPPVPEPCTLLLVGSGVLGAAGLRKRLKRA